MKMTNALKINSLRCKLAIIVCALLCVLVFLGVCIQLLDEPNPEIQEVGWKTYHLFTILSNMLMAASAAICIPYAVDGLRNHNYHLPRWVVDLLFMGTTGVTVTFLVAIAVLSPAAGFYRVMLWSNNLYLHSICPVLSILLFFFINSDHRIKLKSSFLAILPVMAYAVVYVVMVFAIGENAGGWRDHYQIQTIADLLQKVPVVEAFEADYVPPEPVIDTSEDLIIDHEDDFWSLDGPWLQNLVASVNFNDHESLMWFDRILRDAGVFDRLESMGIQDGDTVSIYDITFEYQS